MRVVLVILVVLIVLVILVVLVIHVLLVVLVVRVVLVDTGFSFFFFLFVLTRNNTDVLDNENIQEFGIFFDAHIRRIHQTTLLVRRIFNVTGISPHGGAALNALKLNQAPKLVDGLKSAIRSITHRLAVFYNSFYGWSGFMQQGLVCEAVAGRCFPVRIGIFKCRGGVLPIDTQRAFHT